MKALGTWVCIIQATIIMMLLSEMYSDMRQKQLDLSIQHRLDAIERQIGAK